MSDLAKDIMEIIDSGVGDRQTRINQVRELCAAKPKKAKKKDGGSESGGSDNAAKEGAAA